MRTLQRKLIVKINSMKGKNLSIMAMIAAVFCSCGQQPAQERGPRPVKLAEVTSLSRIESRIQVLCRLISSVTWPLKCPVRW